MTTGGRTPALAARGLGKRYGRRSWALRGCDFHVPAGSVCGLVGPNGAGKSTLLALAAGLLEPTEGELLLFGAPLTAPDQRQRLAFVAQRKPLYGQFTVDDMLRLGRELNPRWDEARARRVIDAGRPAASARISSLSGGQHTLVALAVALGKQADLLLLRPALYAAALAGAVTGREWGSRRVALTLAQSVPARRWFAARWTGLAVLFTVLLVLLVALYRRSAVHAVHLDLLTSGVDRQTAYFTIGPVTLAYVLLGIAAGALAGTALRNAWAALAAAPAATWLITAVLTRSRAALLLDFPAWSHVHGTHPGGVLGLQFYDALPQDTYLVGSLRTGDYWPYPLAETALVAAIAALLLRSALRIVQRRTGRS